MKEGYLYIATGKKYLKEALISVLSLKKICPTAHATLITDTLVNMPEFDAVQVLNFKNESNNNWKQGILFKVMALQNSPYEKTFFVDTDTYFTNNCHGLFDLLDHYDLLICHDQARNPKIVVAEKEVDGYEAYNTGVMVYINNDRINELFKKWLFVYKEKYKLYPHDQPPLMEALLYRDVKLYVLPIIYNFRFGFYGYLKGEVKIIHGRSNDFVSYNKKINSITRARVWLPDTQKLYTPKMSILSRIVKKVNLLWKKNKS